MGPSCPSSLGSGRLSTAKREPTPERFIQRDFPNTAEGRDLPIGLMKEEVGCHLIIQPFVSSQRVHHPCTLVLHPLYLFLYYFFPCLVIHIKYILQICHEELRNTPGDGDHSCCDSSSCTHSAARASTCTSTCAGKMVILVIAMVVVLGVVF